MPVHRLAFLFFVLFPAVALAQNANTGTVSGSVVDPATHQPVHDVTVMLTPVTEGKVLQAATDAKGAFSFENVPFSKYTLAYGTPGTDARRLDPFALDFAHSQYDTGQLKLANAAVKMEKIEVTSTREAFYNSIDRKVYSVGKEIQSTSGTASDLMQNIPSVQVDVDGNVSLRGSESVLILIDGRPSTLMGANRAAVLEQMPADTIDRIEVITNPSAKYKPDGTSGIINIVLKKDRTPGYSGVLRASVGNAGRFSSSVSGNYNPGKYNLYGSYSLRQDDRVRTATDNRTHLDPKTNTFIGTRQFTTEHSRPLSYIGQLGLDYKIQENDSVGAVFRYNRRTFERHATEDDQSLDLSGTVVSEYHRTRLDPEFETDVELKTTYRHSFDTAGEELNLEMQASDHREQEDNHYTNIYRLPLQPSTFDNKRITQREKENQEVVEYGRPFANEGKWETGYSRQEDHLDASHFGTLFDPSTGNLTVDPTATNRFIFHQTVHALYGTLGRPWKSFGVLAGLRIEQSFINTDQVTTQVVGDNRYLRFYPTLHLSYNLSEASQLQLNYSRRVRRPDSEDLNPYPEYQDPFNIRAGNPKLLPEDIHSIEAGYQYKRDNTTYLATLYYRQLFHGFTQITRYIDASTLLTTRENLAKNRSGGIELAATRDIGSRVSFNASGNIYYSEIDASNLGFAARKSTITWDGKLSANYHVSKATLFQFNGNYTARRLTPQGYRYPAYVANLGLKHDLKGKRASLVLTVSDLFNSFKERTLVDTPTLHDETTRRRSSRLYYVGVIYNFGKVNKKAKDDSLQYDTSSP